MRRIFVVLAMLVALTAWARADVLTFDDIPCNACATPIPNGYGGLNWQNFWIIDPTNIPGYDPSGYVNGIVSPDIVAFNGFEQQAFIVSGPAFTFNSAYFTGAWRDGLYITVQGFLDGNSVMGVTFVVNSSGPTQMFFGWTVDYLVFSSSGGVENPDYAGSGAHFAMDNFDYTPGTPIPEPGTMTLIGTGVALLVNKARKRLAA